MKKYFIWLEQGPLLALLVGAGAVGFTFSAAINAKIGDVLWRALPPVATLAAVGAALVISLRQRNHQLADRHRAELRQELRDAMMARASLIHFHDPLVLAGKRAASSARFAEKHLLSGLSETHAQELFEKFKHQFTFQVPVQVTAALPNVYLLGDSLGTQVSHLASSLSSVQSAFDILIDQGASMAKHGHFLRTLRVAVNSLNKFSHAVTIFPPSAQHVKEGQEVRRLLRAVQEAS